VRCSRSPIAEAPEQRRHGSCHTVREPIGTIGQHFQDVITAAVVG
jgi:hypothetical protein